MLEYPTLLGTCSAVTSQRSPPTAVPAPLGPQVAPLTDRPRSTTPTCPRSPAAMGPSALSINNANTPARLQPPVLFVQRELLIAFPAH